MTAELRLQAVGDGIGPLAVIYRRVGDRFQHAVYSGAEDAFAWLTAVEEPAEDPAWPADPPLQQLSLEPIREAGVVLGVGQAGCGHWSCSTEVVPGPEPTLLWDLACRTPDAAAHLGSQYRVGEGVSDVQLDGFVARLIAAHPVQQLELLALLPNEPPGSAIAPSWTWDEANRLLRLTVPDAVGPLPRTRRWQLIAKLQQRAGSP